VHGVPILARLSAGNRFTAFYASGDPLYFVGEKLKLEPQSIRYTSKLARL
jgi:hypothetical protein